MRAVVGDQRVLHRAAPEQRRFRHVDGRVEAVHLAAADQLGGRRDPVLVLQAEQPHGVFLTEQAPGRPPAARGTRELVVIGQVRLG